MNYDLLGQFLYNIILVEIIPNNPLHDLDHFPAHKNPGGNQLIAFIKSDADCIRERRDSNRSTSKALDSVDADGSSPLKTKIEIFIIDIKHNYKIYTII